MALVRRERGDWPDRFLFRRLFDTDWDAGLVRVEEFRDGDELVVRAELPGIDPDKDVEATVADGVLHISAHREEKSEHKDKQGYRSEFRYGSFAREISLPSGVDESKVKATYTDGVLEVRAPLPPAAKAEAKKVPIGRGKE
jgi:HSP20 family protein